MKRAIRLGAVLVALTLVAAACGDDEPDAGSGGAVCPTNLVIQTDWWPEIEHGGTYELIGAGGTADINTFAYSGPIQDEYAVGGIETVEIRAGGDAIGFQAVAAVMRTDDTIYLGYVNTDDTIQQSPEVPVIGVAGTLEINPQMIMWDPAQTNIDPANPVTIRESGRRMLHFANSTYVDYLIGQGFLDPSQSDPNYGGAPDQWVANAGDFIQQGFATNEVYKYENDIEGWQMPVDFLLIDSLGYRPYPAMYAILSERLDAERDCLEVLVPVLQQAWVDFHNNPSPTGDALIGIAEAYENYWRLSEGINERAVELFRDLGIGGNGSDSTYGNFDLDRVQELLDILTPILADKGIDLPDGYGVDDIVTNEFIDPDIGV